MANNGRDYFTVNYMHINIRHLFVKDIFNRVEIEVKYCPTHLMIAEYFIKPLQGKMFQVFRNLVMWYVHINDILQAIELSDKEYVEKSKCDSNSINNNRKIICADVFKALKKKDIKEGEIKYILTQN